MALIGVYGEGTVTGTGATDLTNDSADSATTVTVGQTFIFDTQNRTVLDVDETLPVNDAGTTNFVTTPTMIDGNTIGPVSNVELNYGFLTEDPDGNLFTVWVFSYDNSDADQFYIISDMGIPTRDGANDIITVTQTDTDYSGQELRVIDQTSLATGATTDPALDDFMLGDGTLTFNPANNDLASAFGITALTDTVCFAGGTLILTGQGQRPVETLRVGDLIWTKDHGLQQLRWIGSQRLTINDLRYRPNLRPISIAAEALGTRQPTRELVVSPQHRLLVKSKIARRMFGEDEVLVAAKHLTTLPGIDVTPLSREVEYFQLLLDQHEVILSNGSLTETLYVGSETLKRVPEAAIEEVSLLFPELKKDQATSDKPRPAALLAPGRRARKLAERHAKNRMALVA